MSLRPCLFLDRDGVINHDPGDYTKNLSEFTILPTVMEALQVARDAGFEVVLITNQGGLAKGLYTHEDVAEIHERNARKTERPCSTSSTARTTPRRDVRSAESRGASWWNAHAPNTGSIPRGRGWSVTSNATSTRRRRWACAAS